MNLVRTSCLLLQVFSLVSSGALVLASLSLGLSHPAPMLCILVAGVSYIAPRAACCIALALLPLGGNRPGTTHALYSILVGASLLIGLTAHRVFRTRTRSSQSIDTALANPLLFVGLLYCFFSVASLISVPLNHLLDDLRNIVDRSSLRAIGFSILSIIQTSEHTLVYSYVSVYLTLLAYTLGLHVFWLCRQNVGHSRPDHTPRMFIGATGLGLLASGIIGLLDYYHCIDLRPFRSLDPIVNPGDQQFRLQSLFAHSGWYAEYVTLTIPTCLVLLALNAPFWIRAATIIVALALGEFILILTYQRGGWISYPLTLFAVWAAIYVVRCLEQQRIDVLSALKKSLAKVIISLPLTVIASLALVIIIQGRESVELTLSPYVSRFKDIQRTGDRTDFFFAGMLIGSRHPVLGGGSDSFAWQFEREFESPRGSFPGRYVLPLHGSAHNVYAQTFAGKGLVGLLLLIALPLLLIIHCRKILFESSYLIPTKLIAVIGACFGCAFLIYGNVQEVFYIQVLQFLFFAIVATVASVGYDRAPYSLHRQSLIPAICVAVVAIHAVWELVIPGTTRMFYSEDRPFGCFGEERAPSGTAYRWCGEHSLSTHSITPDANSLTLILEAGPIPQTLTITTSNLPPVRESLAAGERRNISIPIRPPSANTVSVSVRIDALASFVPTLKWRHSSDPRRLAFKIISPSP